MSHAITPVPQRLPLMCPSPQPISYALVRRRMHTLEMPETVLELCSTIGEVQQWALPYYRQQAKRFHPDTAIWRTCVAVSRVSGTGFRRIVAAYTWLMGLNPRARLRRLPPLPAPVLEHDYPDVGRGYHILYA